MDELSALIFPALAGLILLALIGSAVWSRRPRPPAALLQNLAALLGAVLLPPHERHRLRVARHRHMAARLGGEAVSGEEIHGNYQGIPWRLSFLRRDGWCLQMDGRAAGGVLCGLPEGLSVEVRAGEDGQAAALVEQTGDPEFDRCFLVSGPLRLRMAVLSGAARSHLLALRASRPRIRDGALLIDIGAPGANPQEIHPDRLEECHRLIRMCSVPTDNLAADIESRLHGQLSDPHPAVRRLALDAMVDPLPPRLIAQLLQDDDPDLKLAILALCPDLEEAQVVAIWRSILSSRRQLSDRFVYFTLSQNIKSEVARTLDPAVYRDMHEDKLCDLLTYVPSGHEDLPLLDACLAACLTRPEPRVLRQALLLCTHHGGPSLLAPLQAVQRACTVSLFHSDIARAAAVARAEIIARHGGSGGLSVAEGGGLALGGGRGAG